VQGPLQRLPKWGWEYNIKNCQYIEWVFRCLWFSINVCIGREDIPHMVQANKQIDSIQCLKLDPTFLRFWQGDFECQVPPNIRGPRMPLSIKFIKFNANIKALASCTLHLYLNFFLNGCGSYG
jgi:hypothetical protein